MKHLLIILLLISSLIVNGQDRWPLDTATRFSGVTTIGKHVRDSTKLHQTIKDSATALRAAIGTGGTGGTGGTITNLTATNGTGQTFTITNPTTTPNIALALTADAISDGTTNKTYTATEKTKLAGVATGATANSSDAILLNRANHTGTQLASTISDFQSSVSANTTVTANTGNITALNNIAVARRAYGICVPAFKSTGKFDNISAALSSPSLAIHSSGTGVVSATSGTIALGYMRLPQEVTGFNFTRTDWLVSRDMSETNRWQTFSIGDTVTGYKINVYDSSGYLVVKWPSAATTSAAMTGTVNLTVSFATGNGGITASVSVLGLPSITGTNPFRVPVFEYNKLVKTKLFYAGFATNATSSKLTGFLHNKNGWDGDPTGQLLTQTVILNGAGAPYNSATTLVEHENMIVIPARASLATPLKVVHFFHGRTLLHTSFLDVTIADAGETARQLLNGGYAIIGTSGGNANYPQERDWWGNDIGTERAGQVFDAANTSIKNLGKEYLVGWSMGGVSCANYLRRYPERVGAIWLSCPVLDLEENNGTLSIQGNTTLKSSTDLAYNSWYLSLVASNTADPQTDGGTNWRQVSGPGELPNIGVRNYTVTTVGTAATNNATIALASGTRIYPGDIIYFKYSGQTRIVSHQATGLPNSVALDAPITVAVGDPVSIIRNDGRAGYDFQWTNRPPQEWVAGSYGANTFYKRKSAHPELDVKSYNPANFYDLFAGLNVPFHIMVGGDGTSTGNDGVLNNAPMFAFRDGVNAIRSGLVTLIIGSGGHLASTTLSATDTKTLFDAN